MKGEMEDVFDGLTDPRRGSGQQHPLHDILVIDFCTLLCGGETCADMALFGRANREFLESFLKLENGVPSHDMLWTNDAGEAIDYPRKYYYLPRVIMHELGHAAGLGHPDIFGAGYLMGRAIKSKPVEGPTDYDLDGIKHIYENHSKH